MAKLPGILDLGAVTGAPGRPVGTYDPSGFARGGQAIAAGVQAAGGGVAKLGEGVEAYSLDKNRWEYAQAHADFLSRKIDRDATLATDVNYGPDDSGKTMPERYGADIKDINAKSATLISDPRMRERFTSTTEPVVEQGIKTAEAHARGLENNALVAYVQQQGENFKGKAVSADDDTRAGIVDTYNGLVDGLVAKGARTPTEAVGMKQAWAQQYAVADLHYAFNSGDPRQIEAAIGRLRAQPGSPADITDHILQVEGTGPNPRSSATGAGQFIGSTWLDLIKKNRPDLADGRSDAELLALRADRGLGRDMTEAYRADNEAYLKRQGIAATPGAQYLAHFLGAAGATAVLQADPRQPVADALAKAVGPDKAKAMVEANPEVLRGQLSGSIARWADAKMGGSGGSAGHIYDLIPPPAREQLIGQGLAALHKTEVGDRVAFESGVADDVMAAGRAGELPAQGRSREQFIAEYGYEEGEKRYKTYGENLQLGIDAHAMAGMSAEDRAAMIERYTPQPGEGYVAAAKRQDLLVGVDKSIEAQHAAAEKRANALADAADKLVKERDEDPAAYAIKYLPGVSDSWGKLQDAMNGGTALDPAAAARDYAATTLYEQQRLGVAPDAQTVAPKSYVQSFRKAISAAADSDDATKRTGLIAQVHREAQVWGENWPSVMRQMAPTVQPIVRAIAAGADPVAMTRLLSLPEDENPAKILEEQSETKFKDLTGALNTEMAPFLKSLVGRQRDRDFGAYYGLGKKLAALYIRDGDDASTAAHKAFNALIGDRYEFRDTWRMPKSAGVSADDVQAGVEGAKLAISNGPQIATSLEDAKRDLNLTPQEEALYRRHVDNLTGPGGVDNPDGSRSSLYQAVQEHNGKFYNIPTVWNGKREVEKWTDPNNPERIMDVPNTTALANVTREGWDKFPSYATPEQADERYDKMHTYMERDTARFIEGRKGDPLWRLRLAINDAGVTDNRADSFSKFARGGKWVTSADNSGLNLVYDDKFVRTEDGAPLLMEWADLAKRGTGFRKDTAAGAASSAAGP